MREKLSVDAANTLNSKRGRSLRLPWLGADSFTVVSASILLNIISALVSFSGAAKANDQ